MKFSITLPALRSYLMEYALANNYDLPPDETIEAAVKALYLFPGSQGVGKLAPEPRNCNDCYQDGYQQGLQEARRQFEKELGAQGVDPLCECGHRHSGGIVCIYCDCDEFVAPVTPSPMEGGPRDLPAKPMQSNPKGVEGVGQTARECVPVCSEHYDCRECSAHAEYVTEVETLTLRAELQRLSRRLVALTPGGSEFVDDPQRCLDFIKQRMDTVVRIAAERNGLRAGLQQARAYITELLAEAGEDRE